MKVVFALRGDAASKAGGDSRKVARYINVLQDRGHVGQVVTSQRELSSSGADVVHIMNLDLPLENYAYAQVAKDMGTPIVLSTIHHPWDGFAAMTRLGADRFYRAANRFVPPSYSVIFRERVKLFARRETIALRKPLDDFLQAQRRLVANVDLLLPMAPGELTRIEADLGLVDLSERADLVPNGVTFSSPTLRERADRRAGVAISGRIEPRKSSLETARFFAAVGQPATFMGALNERHSGYCQEFLRTIRRAPNLTYLGRLDQTDLRATLLRSDSYMNAAWMEVVSQADIEALSLGCRVATTKYSYIEDVVPSGAVRLIDPASVADESRWPRLFSELADLPSPTVPEAITWEQVGARLISAYERARA